VAAFRDFDDPRFVAACKQMKSEETLPNAVVLLSEILKEDRHIESDLARCRSLWKRGECLQRWGIYAKGIGETLSAFQQAEQDFRASVASSPEWFARRVQEHDWFPENSFIVPAYRSILDGLGERLDFKQSNVVQALQNMGMEASPALPSLRDVRGLLSHSALNAIKRITAIDAGEKVPFSALRLRIDRELQVYPTDQDQFPADQFLTGEDVELPEWELVGLLNNQHWASRAKAACILRFTVDKPDKSVVQKLFGLLESGEKRAIVRGQCARTLGHYASRGALQAEDHERLLRVLMDKLTSDSAYPVRAIAAEVLSDCGTQRPEIRECLFEAFRNAGKEDPNVQRALVNAIGAFGSSARELLPIVMSFEPHHRDNTGHVVKAAAILRIIPPGEQVCTLSLMTLIEALWFQPFAAPLWNAREIRKVALDAIQTVPMPEPFRRKLVIERMMFDDSAEIRAEAAHALMRLDRDLAVQAGAPGVLQRLGR